MEVLSKFLFLVPETAEALGSGKWKFFLHSVLFAPHIEIRWQKNVSIEHNLTKAGWEREKKGQRRKQIWREHRERQGVEDTEWDAIEREVH